MEIHGAQQLSHELWQEDALPSPAALPQLVLLLLLFSAGDQLAYMGQDLFGCCGWHLFHFQDVWCLSQQLTTWLGLFKWHLLSQCPTSEVPQ